MNLSDSNIAEYACSVASLKADCENKQRALELASALNASLRERVAHLSKIVAGMPCERGTLFRETDADGLPIDCGKCDSCLERAKREVKSDDNG